MSPSAVALASVIQALENNDISKDECTVLNISGGGSELMKSELNAKPIKPWKVVSKFSDVTEIIDAL